MAESGSPDDGSDRRLWIKWGVGVLAGVAFLVLLCAVFRYESRGTFRCPNCLSTMESEYVGFKISHLPAFGGTPRSVTTPSVVFQEVYGFACAHRWPLLSYSEKGGQSREHVRLVNLQAAGNTMATCNPLAVGYTTTPRFRTLVQERLASGALTRKRATELFSIPAWLEAKQAGNAALRPLMDEANALLEAGGLPPHPAWAPTSPKKQTRDE